MKTVWPASLVLLAGLPTAFAGPPFQTDDPEPIDYKNYEFYTFATVSTLPGEVDTEGPAIEFNWGALPNVHLHIIIPATSYFPDQGSRAFGIGDIELGIKYRFIQETKTRPEIGTFVMFELPSGDTSRGLGVGKTWYKLPLWAQKSWGSWTSYGGGGETLVPPRTNGYRSYPFGGWLIQRELGKKFRLATEVYYHGQILSGTGLGYGQATLLDLGGYYKFHGDESSQLLFCYGHSVGGEPEHYAYLGLYWTWGKKADPDVTPSATPSAKPGFMAARIYEHNGE
jgi:hypothetical protein